TGGMTSHAAVVARGMGTPCVSGAKGVTVEGKQATIGSVTFKEGDWITIDGTSGEVYEGKLPLIAPDISKDKNVNAILTWCDEIRNKAVRGNLKGFEVRANADQPQDAKRAFDFGAQGIGLCRTEHMFFDKDKLTHFRAMIVADTYEERMDALSKILPLQQKDFFGIFKAMEGKPVTIRLLDPPLHEFVPHTKKEIAELAKYLKMKAKDLEPKIDKLMETNPMLGHRGCRLAVTHPEIYDMQVEAIALAAADCIQKGIKVDPEIMIPIVVSDRELKLLRPSAEKIIAKVSEKTKIPLHFKIGTMIEVPRAAIRSADIAQYADFYSFGTNDLTQMTFAFSRDDSASFLPAYIEKKVLDVDPFKTIDEEGVGYLISYATQQGRSVKPDLKVGICGEHGGDPTTIDFCYRAGLSYVSCSPFRVPLARLACAQAVLNNPGEDQPEDKKAGKPGRKAKAGKSADAVKPVKPTVKPAKKAKAEKSADSAKSAKPAAKPRGRAKNADAAEKPAGRRGRPPKK
ncbi:MAG: PEP-utilizing enzyme, partial [Treponema sp.]|nr:PEP-utilizing enzyme [Treponema sp.]